MYQSTTTKSANQITDKESCRENKHKIELKLDLGSFSTFLYHKIEDQFEILTYPFDHSCALTRSIYRITINLQVKETQKRDIQNTFNGTKRKGLVGHIYIN